MQHERLREHWKFGRAEFVFAVMADDQVLDQNLEFRGKSRDQNDLLVQHLKLDDHVAE